MPNVSSFGAQTDNSVVQGTVTDRAMVIPDVPPSGLMSVGPRVTPHFVKPSLWSALTTYHFFDAVHDAAGASYVAIKPEVPAGTELTDEGYWFLWADPNSQFADLSELVKTFNGRITQNAADIATKAPNNHASEDTTYGVGDEVNYGHVRLATNDTPLTSGANEGIAATPKMIGLRCTFVTPEQFGASGNGVSDDTVAIKQAIASGKTVFGNGTYKCTAPIDLVNSHQIICLNTLTSTANYALSIGNDSFGQDVHINTLTSTNAGLILKTSKITARHNVHIGVISALNGAAVEFAGGTDGVLDCYFSGQAWEGTTCALKVTPSASFIGNITFDSIRFTATEENSTQIILDSTNGSITQLHFPNCSVEPEGSTKACNGILVNVVNTIEFVDGYFRTMELTGKKGFILKIKGAIQQQLSEGLHFTFDHITPNKIDVSEVNMSRYYSLDAPICTIDCNKIVFASQPQSTKMTIYGNRKHCTPNRRVYALSDGDYTWNYEKKIQTDIEFKTAGTLTLPEWFDPDKDTLFVNPASNTITVKTDEYGTDETIGTLSNSTWCALTFYRDNSNKLYMINNK